MYKNVSVVGFTMCMFQGALSRKSQLTRRKWLENSRDSKWSSVNHWAQFKAKNITKSTYQTSVLTGRHCTDNF